VLEDAGGEALAFGPAHVAATPEPGDNGTSVIAGHRDTHFNFIKDLKVGDEIDVATRDGRTITFHMTGSAIVHSAGRRGIDAHGLAPRLALVTCYPFDAIGQCTAQVCGYSPTPAKAMQQAGPLGRLPGGDEAGRISL